MAKRSNPFTEDFIPQSKMHVGIKQYNNNEDRLKKVYEKTLLLLFRGAKKCPTSELCNIEDRKKTDMMTSADNHSRMKQLFIGKDGTLLHIGNMISGTLGIKQCSCGSGAESQCAYCEVDLCSECQHNCDRCKKGYCLHCTTTRLEDSEVCVSCYS
ncbi:apoptosis regulatory protein Siva [Trichoplusia ni]|uniref:Apoptosis regulatory protein Siva n=1 Tax=Trichoplusia ni TaxID=7111 RepID=A0A7E5VGQ8_TRINI|nr:apoptosis regulatory protein Siva [Trichoplusia ni]